MCRDILPKLGRRVQYRLARFDPLTGELDLRHLASLIDARTKLVCCTGASNFFGTKNPIATIRALANASRYQQPGGERRSYLLVDGAQLAPGTFVDVQALDVDYLSSSFHKMLAPFGVGVLYAKEHLLESSLPFLYGGDMIAEGRVFADRVGYNVLPWKYAAGTPNILGTIVSAQALRILLDLALTPKRPAYFGTGKRIERPAVECAMGRVAAWNRRLTARALYRIGAIPGITIYGPRDASERTSLVAFNVAGRDPMDLWALSAWLRPLWVPSQSQPCRPKQNRPRRKAAAPARKAVAPRSGSATTSPISHLTPSTASEIRSMPSTPSSR